MFRLFKKVIYPKNYESNCKFVEYLKRQHSSFSFVSLLEEEEKQKDNCREPSTFTKIFSALKEIDEFKFGILYTYTNGYCLYLKLIKEDSLIKIAIIEPTGVLHASDWVSNICNKLFTAMGNSDQPIVIFLNNRELQCSDQERQYFPQYILEYDLQHSIIFPDFDLTTDINSCVNTDTMPKTFTSAAQINEDYRIAVAAKIKDIQIKDFLAYSKNSVNDLVKEINQEAKYKAVL